MGIKAILFDLDGTLLPMDQEIFARAYLGGLGKTAAALGYDFKSVMEAIVKGTYAMVNNSGEKTNEAVFWELLTASFGESILNDYHMFDEFYRNDFQKIREVCGFEPRAKQIIECVKERGLRVILATNPLFPSIATESRIRWAGLSPDDFEFFTAYENFYHCKPNLDYYREILDKIDLPAEECVMVGNDVGEDMIASQLGMRVFLLTDCVINRVNEDISVYPHGGATELLDFIKSLDVDN